MIMRARVALARITPRNHENVLAGAGVRGGQLAVAGGPDAGDAAAGAEEQCGRSQGYKGHQERVLDEILALFVFKKVREKEFHELEISAGATSRTSSLWIVNLG
jgi:hypothetical protein